MLYPSLPEDCGEDFDGFSFTPSVYAFARLVSKRFIKIIL